MFGDKLTKSEILLPPVKQSNKNDVRRYELVKQFIDRLTIIGIDRGSVDYWFHPSFGKFKELSFNYIQHAEHACVSVKSESLTPLQEKMMGNVLKKQLRLGGGATK